MNPDHTTKERSPWPTLLVRIARRKKNSGRE